MALFLWEGLRPDRQVRARGATFTPAPPEAAPASSSILLVSFSSTFLVSLARSLGFSHPTWLGGVSFFPRRLCDLFAGARLGAEPTAPGSSGQRWGGSPTYCSLDASRHHQQMALIFSVDASSVPARQLLELGDEGVDPVSQFHATAPSCWLQLSLDQVFEPPRAWRPPVSNRTTSSWNFLSQLRAVSYAKKGAELFFREQVRFVSHWLPCARACNRATSRAAVGNEATACLLRFSAQAGAALVISSSIDLRGVGRLSRIFVAIAVVSGSGCVMASEIECSPYTK